jgi:hypothetical protein
VTLELVQLLTTLGFDKRIKTRLVRHAPHNLKEILERDMLGLYTAYERDPRFDGCKQVVCFYRDKGTRARFHGVYRVLGKRAAKNGDIPRNNDLAKRWKAASHHFYVLELDEQFADLKDRLVIEWGRGYSGMVSEVIAKQSHTRNIRTWSSPGPIFRLLGLQPYLFTIERSLRPR